MKKILAACLTLFPFSPAVFADDAKTNVVFIISDDQAWTDYSFMGHQQLQTPNIDKLAKGGMTFRNGYVPSSLCCPSLASLLTGKYPHQHKITGNDPPYPDGKPVNNFYSTEAYHQGRETMNRFMDAQMTLPRILAKNGYISLQTGKWWQGDFTRGGFTHGMSKGERHGDDGLDIGRKTMQPIDDFLDLSIKEKKPFFLWYAPMMPHDPHTPPQRLLDKYKTLTPSIHQARYWAMVEWFDETVGQLRASLEQRQLSNNTLIVYMTDNGWIQNLNNPGHSPRCKYTPYETGLRTPIMFHMPGKIPAQICDDLASTVDVLPTVLSFLNLKMEEKLAGIDLLKPEARRGRHFVSGACFTHNAVSLDDPEKNLMWRWIVADGWKLIVPQHPENEPKSTQLFHLTKDPGESTDLSKDNPEQLKKLTAQLDSWWKP